MAPAPVCGADGITYANACVASCQGITVAAQGECGVGASASAATATAAAAAGAPSPIFPGVAVIASASTVGLDTLNKYRSDGFSFVARTTFATRKRAVGPQPDAPPLSRTPAGTAATASR